MKNLMVKEQYLAWEDGSPFFFLADTAWELAHRLDRQEVEHYFRIRKRQGFDAAQIVALAEFEGLTVPNAYGRLPLQLTDGLPDPEKPDTAGDYSYWDHLDYIVETAAAHDMFVTLLPTWGDKFNLLWGQGPVVFTPENAYTYGAWIGARYAGCWNIIWMLGGDRPLLEPKHRAIIDAMAAGIRSADPSHLMTFHPPGKRNSVEYVGDADYIAFHASQTSHGIEQCYDSDLVMLEMRKTGKPYFDSEPRYEDHPACLDVKTKHYWNAADVRFNAYRSMLAGVCGHTYGNHCIWSMNREAVPYFPYVWQEALIHPGAEQLHHVKTLRLSRDYFSLRPAKEAVLTEYHGMGRVTAARGRGYLYAYSPMGLAFSLEYTFPEANWVRASWFDPRTGEEAPFTIVPPCGRMTYVPPVSGTDWVLILDADQGE